MKKQWREWAALFFGMLGVYTVLWCFTGESLWEPATYNSYVLQANRWLSGHLDLGQDYPYLEIARFGGKYFISFPPIPSVILLPFCVLFGGNPPDTLIAVAIGMLGGFYAYRMMKQIGRDGKGAVFWALFLTVGSNFLHICHSADVWYLAQNCAFAFTMIALYHSMTEGVKDGWIPLFSLALAVGCRPFQILFLPLILFLLWKKVKQSGGLHCLCKCRWWILPPLCVGLFLMGLNLARFGNPFQFGHDYLPEFALEKPAGQFATVYFAENFKRLWQIPALSDGIVSFPTFNGCAFWIFSPICLVFAAFGIKNWKRAFRLPEWWLSVLLIAAQLICLSFHATMGGWQFGNRYTVDMLPVLFFALTRLLSEDSSDMEWLSLPLFLWGAGVNLTGTIALLNGWI